MSTYAPSPRVIGRLAGVLLVASGALSAVTLPLPQPPGTDKKMVLIVSLLAIAIGGAVFVLPWRRWHPRATLVMLPVAFALISAGNYLGNAQPYTYSVFFIVAFVWLGLGHPRWTSLWFLGPAAVAYALPFVLRGESTGAAGASVALVIPVCAFVAETVAWIGARDRRSRTRLQAFARVASSLGPQLNVDDLSQTLASEMQTMLHADRGVFFLVHDRVIDKVFSAGFPDDVRERLHSLSGQGLGDAPGLADLAAGRPVITEDTHKGSPLIADPGRVGVRSYIAVPVLVDDELRGILLSTNHGRARRYRAADVRSATALAAQASAALRYALVYEQTLEAAQRDHLTGLGNRRAFSEQLTAEVERARRHARDLSVLVLDLDHLKDINDTRGHAAGDEALENVGSTVRSGSRREDGVFRIGGDEFALVLPETGSEEACAVAERIRLSVRRGQLTGNNDHPLTVSVGVSSFPEHGSTADELFERADAAMYEVKRAGRDAVCAFSHHEPGPGVMLGVDVRTTIARSQLVAAYQPVVNLETRTVIGYEAFCRLDPAHGSAPTSTVFRAASILGLTEALDRRCRAVAIDGARGLDDNLLLFVNASPAAVAAAGFDVEDLVATIVSAQLRPEQVVIEVTEHDRSPDPALISNLQACQAAGLSLSLDDFGEAATDLDLVATIAFDFVKIDPRAIRGNEELRRRMMLGLLVVLREVGARLLAERIENAEDLALVTELGFEAAQGRHVRAAVPASGPMSAHHPPR